jgi:hypothetical protein
MTSGNIRILWSLCLLLSAPLIAQSAELEPNALLARLARPAPTTIAFTEVRFSKLLKAPLVVSGELGYEGPGALNRRVLQPYHEETKIRGESVSIQREQQAPRSFGLQRAPELRALLTGFAGLLGGDHAALEQQFSVAVSGTDEGWKLTLTPKDERARQRLQSIEIDGHAAEPRCFAVATSKDASSVMLLGDASDFVKRASVTREAVTQYCGS